MKAVIFDMDGVILDSERLFLICWKKVAEKYHLDNIEEFCLDVTGTNREKTKATFIERYGSAIHYNDIVQEVRDEFHHHELPVKKGAKEILSFLHAHHIPISLASSTIRPLVEKELGDVGLLCYFDEIVTGDMVEKSKPEPDIFLYAAQKLKVDPTECFVVEDSFNGIHAASKAKMKPIMVPDLKQPDETIQRLTWKIMDNLLEVKDYFAMEFHIDKATTTM